MTIWQFTGFAPVRTSLPHPDLPDLMAFEEQLYALHQASTSQSAAQELLHLAGERYLAEKTQRAPSHAVSANTWDLLAKKRVIEDQLYHDLTTLPAQQQAGYWYFLGETALNLGRWGDAMDSFGSCAILLPTQAHAQLLQTYYQWGFAAFQAHHQQQALQSWYQVIHLARRMSNDTYLTGDASSFICYVYLLRALAEQALGRWKRARADTKIALTLLNQWIRAHEQNEPPTTLPENTPTRNVPPSSVVSLSLLPADLRANVEPATQLWLQLAFVVPLQHAEHITWQARFEPEAQPRTNPQDLALKTIRSVIENCKTVAVGAQWRMQAYLAAAEIELATVQQAPNRDIARNWLAEAQLDLDFAARSVDATTAEATRLMVHLGQLECRYRWLTCQARPMAEEYAQVLADIQAVRDAAEAQQFPLVVAHVEQLLGEFQLPTSQNQAITHYKAALLIYERFEQQETRTPHGEAMRQTLHQLEPQLIFDTEFDWL